MTVTESTSTVPASWLGVDVLFASSGEDGPQVTVWTQPPSTGSVSPDPSDDPSDTALDPVAAVAREHAESVRNDGSWVPLPTTAHDDGCGGTYLLRALDATGTTRAAAAYWPSPGGVTVAVARSEGSDDLVAILHDLASTRSRYVLSAEEVLALCEVTGLPTPPVNPSAYLPDAGEDVRQAAHHAARASLVARGLLVPDADRVSPTDDLRDALTLLLDGEGSILVSRQQVDGSSGTSLLGGRGGVLAELGPGRHGNLQLSVGAGPAVAARYAAWLTPVDGPTVGGTTADGGTFRCTVEEVSGCVGSATGPEKLRAARSLASVRGLRRDGEDVAVFEKTWVEDARGLLWLVAPADDLVSVDLTPVAPVSVHESLTEALDLAGS